MSFLMTHYVLKITLFISILTPAFTIVLYKRVNENKNANTCPESHPWPCKTGTCIAFDFICDGTQDCEDGYDENPGLCTAKDRPAFETLSTFIDVNRKWLVPKFLANRKTSELTLGLIEAKTIDDYAEYMKLTPEQRKNLVNMLKAVEAGRRIELMLMGMPPNQWDDVKDYFGRIINSGFLSSIEK